MLVELSYGATGQACCEVDPSRVLAWHPAPAAMTDLAGQVAAQLESPLEFPPLAKLFVPGDRVVVALDRHTPASEELVAAVWEVLACHEISPEDVELLQPAGLDQQPLHDPRGALPDGVREAVSWFVHDPTDPNQQAYLATTAKGERIYLSRRLLDADVTLSVGQMAYDPVLGYRGTSSVFYPGLSSVEAIGRAHGQGHSELGPDDERPLRQTIDEIAWLLGSLFTIQVIPAAGTGVAEVLAGASEAVFRQAKQSLARHWQLRSERADIVVVAVDADAAGHGWRQVGAALSAARRLVRKGGKVVVLSELQAELETGLELLKDSPSPRNAIQPLRQLSPPDLMPATQLASTADWADIYLLSKLDGQTVDDLFMIPLDNEREYQRLLAGEGTCIFLQSAQHVYAEVPS